MAGHHPDIFGTREAILALTFLPFLLTAAHAAYYEYTDEKGVPNITNKMSDIPVKYRDSAKVLPMEEDKRYPEPTPVDKAIRAAQKAAADLQRSKAARPKPRAERSGRSDKSVDLYVTSWCPYCKDMIRFLDSIRAPYTAYDIEKDSEAESRFRKYGAHGVPLVVVDGRAFVGGISQKDLERALRS